MEDKKLAHILEEVKQSFPFLFERGYKIAKTKKLPMGDWEMILTSKNNSIVFVSDRGEFDLGFAPINADEGNQVGIRGMIYYLSDGQKFVGKYRRTIFQKRKGRFEELANLLEAYIDQITPFFGESYEWYRQDLITAGKKYNAIFLDKYLPK